MRSLWEKIQEIEQNLTTVGRGADPWMQYYVYRYRDTIRKTYQMLPLDLQDEEDYYLESLLREGQEMCLQIRKREEEMTGKRTDLRAIHKELMEMCYKPDVELLQELGDKLKCEHFIQQRGQQSAHEAAGRSAEAEVPARRPGRAFGRRGVAVRRCPGLPGSPSGKHRWEPDVAARGAGPPAPARPPGSGRTRAGCGTPAGAASCSCA
ncbi:tripartite motif-containing protein 43-like [Camelus ferus]|uniref:Tripartite motif-containing protein 43-like n=1 Tax=Camelus ferus TaxID=419612 RepID=A0A8B8TVJ4_CAMFR|nr:tripartite motif-containing protein 43-like [Camelus ferus]